jgi:hypothetical protein
MQNRDKTNYDAQAVKYHIYIVVGENSHSSVLQQPKLPRRSESERGIIVSSSQVQLSLTRRARRPLKIHRPRARIQDNVRPVPDSTLPGPQGWALFANRRGTGTRVQAF